MTSKNENAETDANADDATPDFADHAVRVKACILKAKTYGDKAINMETTAAVTLIEVKAGLPHVTYQAWLKANEINARTASRLVAEHITPKKREARRAKANEKAKTEREKAEAKTAKEAAQAEAAKGAAEGRPDDVRTEVLRIVGRLDAEKIAAVYGFLVAEGMAKRD